MAFKKETLRIGKTARYFIWGEPGPHIRNVWFVCHGYGQLAEDFVKEFAVLENKDHLVVAPEALHRFYLYGTTGRIGASWMTREERQDDIADYIAYLDNVYRSVIKRSGTAADRLNITALGFSQGTATACRWALQGGSPVHRLILWGGDFPPDTSWSTGRQQLEKIDILLVAGDKDPLMTPARMQKQARFLEDKGIDFQTKTFPGFHKIDAAVLTELARS